MLQKNASVARDYLVRCLGLSRRALHQQRNDVVLILRENNRINSRRKTMSSTKNDVRNEKMSLRSDEKSKSYGRENL